MSTNLPAPPDIATHYNRLLQKLEGEYIQQRWGESEIKRRHYRQTELALVNALSSIADVGDVLEIGCGPAVWTPLFLSRARSVSLLDISEEMLKHARTRVGGWQSGAYAAKVRYTQGDFITAEVAKGSADTVVSARAFEYMSDKEAFVEKCFSVLRPGGTLILVTKNRNWYDLQKSTRQLQSVPRDRIPVEQAMQLDLRGWRQVVEMFNAAGFSAVRARPVIIGSYELPFFSSRPGLAFADLLHRLTYRKSFSGAVGMLDSLTESFLVSGSRNL